MPARCERRASHTGKKLSHTVGVRLSRTGEDQSSGGEESSHTGEELGRRGGGEDAIAGKLLWPDPAAPDQTRAGRARPRPTRPAGISSTTLMPSF
jgi:hypothetical protein